MCRLWMFMAPGLLLVDREHEVDTTPVSPRRNGAKRNPAKGTWTVRWDRRA